MQPKSKACPKCGAGIIPGYSCPCGWINKPQEINMKAEARALAEVEATRTWKSWSDPKSLRGADDQKQYMQNRLRAAFLLGIEKGQNIAAQRAYAAAMGQPHD